MLIYDKKLDSDYTFFGIPDVSKEKVLYFDIETTGFLTGSSSIYLIGPPLPFYTLSDVYIVTMKVLSSGSGFAILPKANRISSRIFLIL